MDFIKDVWTTFITDNENTTQLWVDHPIVSDIVIITIVLTYYLGWRKH